MRSICDLAGMLLLTAVMVSVLHTLVVPRGRYSVLDYRIWLVLRATLRRIATTFSSYTVLDRVETWLAPLMLLTMLGTWLAGTLTAYTLLLYGTSDLALAAAVREAGSRQLRSPRVLARSSHDAVPVLWSRSRDLQAPASRPRPSAPGSPGDRRGTATDESELMA